MLDGTSLFKSSKFGIFGGCSSGFEEKCKLLEWFKVHFLKIFALGSALRGSSFGFKVWIHIMVRSSDLPSSKFEIFGFYPSLGVLLARLLTPKAKINVFFKKIIFTLQGLFRAYSVFKKS